MRHSRTSLVSSTPLLLEASTSRHRCARSVGLGVSSALDDIAEVLALTAVDPARHPASRRRPLIEGAPKGPPFRSTAAEVHGRGTLAEYLSGMVGLSLHERLNNG